MREIKFRGLRPDGQGWVYGYYVKDPRGSHRIYWMPFDEATYNTYHFVHPLLVGQFTGLKDINGTDIYEGDVVVWKVNDIQRTASVYFDEHASCFWMGRDKSIDQLVLNDWMRGEYQVIGNIHQNPELL